MAARANAQHAAKVARHDPRDVTDFDEKAGRNWIILPQHGGRRWDIVAEGEGTMIASGVHRAIAEHYDTWDPNAVLAVADLIDSLATQYETETVVEDGRLYHRRCGGFVHLAGEDLAVCDCFESVASLIKIMHRGGL
jgi:hypothetical protein